MSLFSIQGDEEKVVAILIIAAAVILCSLIGGVTFYNYSEMRLRLENNYEQVADGAVVIWKKVR